MELLAKAWNTSDAAERRALLHRCCSPTAEFWNPHDPPHGVPELSDAIGQFRTSFPRAPVVFGSVDEHHGHFRVSWSTQWNDGREALEGIDVGQIDKEGRILRLVSFTGPTPRSS